jgi:hypothetical protein
MGVIGGSVSSGHGLSHDGGTSFFAAFSYPLIVDDSSQIRTKWKVR